MKKHLLSILIATILLVGIGIGFASAEAVITEQNIKDGLAFCAEYPVSLTFDGEVIEFDAEDVPPVIITPEGEAAGRTLIPARALFEKAGAAVTWIQETQTVEIIYGNYKVELVIGSQTATVNGENKELEVPAFIIDHDGDYFGSTMIPVRFVAETLNFGVDWDELNRVVVVTSPEASEPNRGDVDRPDTTSGGAIDSNVTGSAVENNGEYGEGAGSDSTSGASIIEGVLFPYYDMTTMPALTENAKGRLIAIDIGHGGRDPGAIGNSGQLGEIREKDVNLAVGLRAAELLEEAGFELFMTRDSDVYVELKSRPYSANDAGAEFLVSFHNNSSESPSINGTVVCYYNKLSEADYAFDSKTIARAVQNEMVKALGTTDRGLSSRRDLAVLNKSLMPAIIIEGAFLSNEENLAMISTNEYIERYAFAATKAIIEMFNEAYPDGI